MVNYLREISLCKANMALSRGPDPWGDGETDHLDPVSKKRALELKSRLIVAQEGREFADPDFRRSRNAIQHTFINSADVLDVFCGDV